MAKELIIFFGGGAFLIFVGVLQIGNVRHALKTGVIAVSIGDTGRARSYNRNKNPIAYHLNFWPSLFGAIVLPIMGIAFIGLGTLLALGYGP